MPGRLGPAVHCEMLGRGQHLKILGIIPLHAGHKCDPHPAREIGIFPVGFLPAPPTRIAKQIDVGRPERESLTLHVPVLAQCFLIPGTRLGADCVCHRIDQRSVPCRRKTDGLRKDGRLTVVANPMESFTPIVIGRYPKSWNCWSHA